MIDPAYCADGCGRLAETERPTADGRREQVCAEHATLEPKTTRTFEELLSDPNEQFDKRSELLASIEAYSKAVPATAGANPPKSRCIWLTAEHSSNPREDRHA